MFWLVVAAALAVGGYMAWRSRKRPQRFEHEGQTYTRQPDGSFRDAAGGLVTSAALIAALGLAYGQHLERAATSSRDDDDAGGVSLGWDGDGGTDSDGSGDSGSGDSGGGDSGGGDGGGGGD